MSLKRQRMFCFAATDNKCPKTNPAQKWREFLFFELKMSISAEWSTCAKSSPTIRVCNLLESKV